MKIKPLSFWRLCWDAITEELIHKVLIVAGIASTILHMIMDADKRSTSWLEGFAIIVAVTLVVVISSLKDLQKEN